MFHHNNRAIDQEMELKAARLEISDLQAEFEVERNDYLASIRRIENDNQLQNSLLEHMGPLVRRDCNYSNLDRLKREAACDEEAAGSQAVHPKVSTRGGLAADGGEPFMPVEEDRYQEMPDRSDSENIASSYFK